MTPSELVKRGFIDNNVSRTLVSDPSLITQGILYNHFMSIAINDFSFDVPAIMVHMFMRQYKQFYEKDEPIPSHITIPLFIVENYTFGYKGLFPQLRWAYDNGSSCGLTPLRYEYENTGYYAAQGIIIDSNYKPILMQSYRFVVDTQDTEKQYIKRLRLEQLCLWINPCVYLKSDPVQKLVLSLIPKCVGQELTVHHITTSPCILMPERRTMYNGPFMKIRTIIDSFPCTMQSPSVPSISTTNEELLQTAIDHIDNLYDS